MIRQAEARDLPAVLGLLSDAELPIDGAAEHLESFFVVDEGDRIVASVGVEVHGDAALLRSLAVAPGSRGAGLGAALLRRALHEASGRAGGVYGLTTTAETYLSRFGFERVPRSSLPEALLASSQLQGACPSSATAMKWNPRQRAG
jgi:amino-acid N-acetyltransferase